MSTWKKYFVERIIERRETHLVSHMFESFLAFASKYIYDRSLNNCKELPAVTVKPDVLLMGTLQTSAATLVFD